MQLFAACHGQFHRLITACLLLEVLGSFKVRHVRIAVAVEKHSRGVTVSISSSISIVFVALFFSQFSLILILKHFSVNFAMAQTEKAPEAESSPDTSPELLASFQDEKFTSHEASSLQLPTAAVGNTAKVSSVLTVFVAGVALFSDGYNAQIIGYMQPLFADL